ncbi:MAG: hypothetical protein WBI29_00600 [Candidatus Saccharimonadales bacterium]
MSKFLLLLGVSGVGKSSIIQELLRLDARFTYISPFMTRALRKDERDKLPIIDEEMNRRRDDGEFLAVNELYGVRYATPWLPIVRALRNNRFPILDWPLSQIGVMRRAFPGQLFIVYVLPPSTESLGWRLAKDGRDPAGHRLQSAYQELKAYQSVRDVEPFNLEVVSEDNLIEETALFIYRRYIEYDQ